MKKLFKIAVLAALAFPLMTECKPKDEPESPEGTEKEFNEWIEEGDDHEIPVTEKNLCGIWQLNLTARADSENNFLDGAYYFTVDHYLEIKDDHTFVDYNYNEEVGSINWYGKWELTGKQISFEYTTLPDDYYYSCFEVGINEYTVFRCEPETLALTYSKEEEYVTQYGNDTTGLLTNFFIFKRIHELPKLPIPLVERLALTPWKVLSDTMYLGKYVHVDNPDNGFGGDVYQPVQVEQTNMLPQNAVITFASDSTLEIKESDGDMLYKGMWVSRGLSALSEFPGVLRSALWIEIQDENGGLIKEQILPIPTNLNFYIDPSNEKRAILIEESLPFDGDLGDETVRCWVYHVEEVK